MKGLGTVKKNALPSVRRPLRKPSGSQIMDSVTNASLETIQRTRANGKSSVAPAGTVVTQLPGRMKWRTPNAGVLS